VKLVMGVALAQAASSIFPSITTDPSRRAAMAVGTGMA
jgi:hypothetical protein